MKWIEELIGRKLSLQANSVIAVSSSGFTEGAIKKAQKYGVILKDLVALTETEISSWTKGIYLSLLFYRYSDFHIKLIFNDEDLTEADINNLQRDLNKYKYFNTLFTAHLNAIEERIPLVEIKKREKPINFFLEFSIEDFYLDGKKVQCIETKGTFYLEKMNLNIPEHMAYGNPYDTGKDRDIYIQRYNMGETKIIHHGEDIAVCLDLSKMDIPPYWQFRFVEMHGEGVYKPHCIEMINPENIVMKVDKFNLTVANKVHNM